MPYLMTAAEFKQKSSKFMSKRQNPLILDLDKLIALFHSSRDNPRRQTKILSLIYVWTKQYLAGGGTRKGVSELQAQAKEFLDHPIFTMTHKLSQQGATWKDGKLNPPSKEHGKALEPAYRIEPLLPGKGSVGGLQLQHDTKRINSPAIRMMMEDADNATDSVKKAEHAMATAPISELLDLYFQFVNSPAAADQRHFEYCNKGVMRENYRVFISHLDGRFYSDAMFLVPYTTIRSQFAKDNRAMYAVDLEGKLYAKHEMEFREGAFNHSSFMSGKPVLCAGILGFDNAGSLNYIDNNSGHYRPTMGDLGYLLRLWQDEYAVDMTGVNVYFAGVKLEINGVQAAAIYGNYPTSRASNM
jgi:hypothetical protein